MNNLRSAPREALQHAAVYMLARGLPGIIAFLAIPLFTRFLEPRDYGRYSLVMATVALLNAVFFQGLRLALVRYLPAYGRESAVALKSTLMTVMLLLLGVLGVCCALVCVAPAVRAWWPEALAGWVMLALLAGFELCCEYSRAVIRPWHYMRLQLTRSAGMVGLGFVFVLLGARWWGPLAGTAGGMALAVTYSYWKHWREVRFHINRDLLVRVCRYGLPLSLTVGLAVLIGASGRFLIAALLGEGAAGLYSVAADLANQTLMLVMIAVSLAVFPLAVRAWEMEGPAAAAAQMRYNASLLLALGVPCVVGLAVLTPGISYNFFGSSFRQSASTIIPLMAIGAFLAGLKACHFDAALQFAHRTIDQVWIVLVAAAANVGMSLVAIRMAGIKGAAVASVMTYLIAITLTIVWGRRYIALPLPARATGQVLLASSAMAALLYPLRQHISAKALAGQVIAGTAVYVLVLLACNFLDLRRRVVQNWRESHTASMEVKVIGDTATEIAVSTTIQTP